MADTIRVMAAKQDDRVVLWEVHPDHPNGEVFIAGNGRATEVALTGAVERRLKTGELVQVMVESKSSKKAKVEATKVEAEAVKVEAPTEVD